MKSCLVEPTPMELISTMPVLRFKPTESSKPEKENVTYACPLYICPVRTETREHPSFVILDDLKSGQDDDGVSADFWTLSGTAMLPSSSLCTTCDAKRHYERE